MNIKKRALNDIILKKGKIEKDAWVFVYPLDTVEFDKEQKLFKQKGSAPNFQGGIITLCTCKHNMRSHELFRNKPLPWVAGISSAKGERIGNKRILAYNLIYLIHVKFALESQWSMQYYKNHEHLGSKSACVDRLGDVYEPKETNKGKHPFDPEFYKTPIESHSHYDGAGWHHDIKRDKYPNIRFLIGNPELSFLWSEPCVRFKPKKKDGSVLKQIWRNYRIYDTLDDFLQYVMDEKR